MEGDEEGAHRHMTDDPPEEEIEWTCQNCGHPLDDHRDACPNCKACHCGNCLACVGMGLGDFIDRQPPR